jgi:hypothetical protein
MADEFAEKREAGRKIEALTGIVAHTRPTVESILN